MKRVLEPELMESHEQVKAYAAADFSIGDASLLIRLEEYISDLHKIINDKSLIIDLGCGPGNITERLFSRWPFAKVIGIDGSEEMLSVARKRQQRIKDSVDLNRFQYIYGNLGLFANERFDFEQHPDVIVTNSVLHHIHDPSLFWKAMKNLGKRGTIIFTKDLRRPSSLQEAKQLQEKYQPNAPTILNKDYLASMQAAFTVDEIRIQLNSAGLYQLKVFEVDDRYLEVIGVL